MMKLDERGAAERIRDIAKAQHMTAAHSHHFVGLYCTNVCLVAYIFVKLTSR